VLDFGLFKYLKIAKVNPFKYTSLHCFSSLPLTFLPGGIIAQLIRNNIIIAIILYRTPVFI
jgi:hypothetical protein